jgi:hypothetical protein
MTDDLLRVRLERAHARLVALRPAVEAGAPWPLSAKFGIEPEASWGPPEVLAHLAEMQPFWLDQLDRVIEGHPEPVPFGRVQSDEARIAAVGNDRHLPLETLYRRIDDGVAAVDGLLATMDAAAAARRGIHPTLGEMTIIQVIERMLVHHLEDHADQLERALATPD